MVLGLRSKNKKAAAVTVDYIIHIKEIRPWPPSQSLKSLRWVTIQWENGDRNSGSTNPVAPTPGSSAAEGKIEFNESFKLQATFLKEGSTKGREAGAFQKNLLELSLYEPRRDRAAAKGQHLGTAVVDLAEHGCIKEAVAVSVPVSSKRSYRNAGQPMLHLRIQPFDRDSVSCSSSAGDSLSKEASLDKDGKESVSALMSEEYAEEAEIASFTDDDDDGSLSSFANSSSAPNAESPAQSSPGLPDRLETVSHLVKEINGLGSEGTNLHPESLAKERAVAAADLNGAYPAVHRKGRLPKSSVDISNNPESVGGVDDVLSSSDQRSSTFILEKPGIPSSHNSSTSVTCGSMEGEATCSNTKEASKRDDLIQEFQEERVDCSGKKDAEAENNSIEEEKPRESRNRSEEVASCNGANDLFVEKEGNQLQDGSIVKPKENQNPSIKVQSLGDGPDRKSIASVSSVEYTPVSQQHTFLQNPRKTSLTLESTSYSPRAFGEKANSTFLNDRLKNLKSVRSPQDSKRSSIYGLSEQYKEDIKEIDLQEDTCNGGLKYATDDGTDDNASAISSADEQRLVSRIDRNGFSNTQVQELELRVQLLEQELREAAAIEIGLFSVVAEHGSSAQKVHTPARRLSRLYIHASRQMSRERRARAARSAVSGLVLAAKACGNDVPRLAFWLSNSIVLRTIISQRIKNSDIAETAGSHSSQNGFKPVHKRKSSILKWESTYRKKGNFSFDEDFNDWEDPDTFIFALEKIETWMFSRIAESVWWQTLTPHMQPTVDGQPKMGLHLKTSFGRTLSAVHQRQANLSIEIWKKAFKDAFERLCPVRAGGHECGCLPMLARLVMEQCVARLDVAMFNAILRESDDEMPTDPVSDPISDPKVLPIPSGKLSFGAGAQLKNAIGNWSRWLTDLFGMDLDDRTQVEAEKGEDRLDVVQTFKSFLLLNALSDLLMLPKDMLLEKTIRKEVCPTFSTSMIKQILDNFLPDEFCPDPIPEAVLEALNSEDQMDGTEDEIRNVPCNARPVTYSPPSVASVESIIGDVRSAPPLQRSGSSVVRKCHTSDDELDELDSPLISFVLDKSSTPTADRSNENTASNALRYQLLREVWRDDE